MNLLDALLWIALAVACLVSIVGVLALCFMASGDNDTREE